MLNTPPATSLAQSLFVITNPRQVTNSFTTFDLALKKQKTWSRRADGCARQQCSPQTLTEPVSVQTTETTTHNKTNNKLANVTPASADG